MEFVAHLKNIDSVNANSIRSMFVLITLQNQRNKV